MGNVGNAVKAVFFDFVGTIITKEGEAVTHQNIIKEILKRAGRQDIDAFKVWEEYEAESSSMFRKLAGQRYVPIKEVDREALRKVAQKYGFNVGDDFWDISLEMHARYGRAFPDAEETLTRLRELGFYVGIITDSDDDYIYHQLKALGMLDLFDSITTSQEAGFYKPHPSVFETALRKAGVEPSEAIYVGDNPDKDCRGAESVGMMSVLLDPDSSKLQMWDRCRVVVSRLLDVVELVEGLLERD